MPRGRIDPWSLVVALAVLSCGGLAVWHGSTYELGRVARMGPGFYPVALGVILIGLGVLNLVEVVAKGELAGPFRLRPFATIALSLWAFATLARPFGLVPATFALVAIASLAERERRPLLALITASALSTFGALIFIYLLQVPLAVVRW